MQSIEDVKIVQGTRVAPLLLWLFPSCKWEPSHDKNLGAASGGISDWGVNKVKMADNQSPSALQACTYKRDRPWIAQL